MRKTTVAFMTGIAFTFGMFLGLLIQLPVATLPVSSVANTWSHLGVKRSLEEIKLNIVRVFDVVASEYKTNERSSPQSPEAMEAQFGNNSQIAIISLPQSEEKPRRDNVQFAEVEQTPITNSISQEKKTHPGEYSQPILQKSVDISGEYKTVSGDGFPNRGLPTTELLPEQTIEISIRVEKLSNSANIKSSHLNNLVQDGQSFSADSKSPAKEYIGSRFSESSILDGVAWSQSVENLCPGGFTHTEEESWNQKVLSSQFVKMEEGCGRMQNRMLTFADATKACARYRLNSDQIQGEIYSYYLAKLLNITNMPPTTLGLVRPDEELWRRVHLDISRSQWSVGKVLVLTKWIDNLSPAYIPVEMREQNTQLRPDVSLLSGKSFADICELKQWSDLVVFDYLTANLDRVVNNMFNRQWNGQMMENPAHNLEKSTDGQLVFLDNESGLFHGYRLLDKYASFHQSLLGSLCVFRKSTMEAVKRLVQNDNVGDEVQTLFAQSEPLYKFVPKIPQKNVNILKQRLRDVYEHITRCENTYVR